MSVYLANELRGQLLDADDHRCAYCQTTQPAAQNLIEPLSEREREILQLVAAGLYSGRPRHPKWW